MMDLNLLSLFPFPVHYLATILPPLKTPGYEALKASIGRHGLRDPIIVWQGQIIDGVHRLMACLELGLNPTFHHLADDDDPAEFLDAEAFPYRDMDYDDRVRAAAKLSQWSTRGRPAASGEKSENFPIITREKAAERFRVSVKSVSTYARVQAEDGPGSPALRQAADEKRIKCSDAARILERPHEVQDKAVDLVVNGRFRTVKRAVEQVERDIAQQENSKKREAIRSNHIRDAVTLHTAAVEDLHELVPQASVDAIITRVGKTKDLSASCQNLSAFAVHALKDTGLLAVIGVGQNLRTMLNGLSTDSLSWIDEWGLEFDGPPLRIPWLKYDVAVSRLPVLVFGKKSFRPNGQNNRIQIPAPTALPLGMDRSGASFEELIKVFAHPGHIMCDPAMWGEHWPALLSWRAGVQFIGADASETGIAAIWERLDDLAIDLGVGGTSEDESLSRGESAPTAP